MEIISLFNIIVYFLNFLLILYGWMNSDTYIILLSILFLFCLFWQKIIFVICELGRYGDFYMTGVYGPLEDDNQ